MNAAKRFAVTRAWAEQAGIALTDGDMAALALQRQELVSFYGEEGYQQQLALDGHQRGDLRQYAWPPST